MHSSISPGILLIISSSCSFCFLQCSVLTSFYVMVPCPFFHRIKYFMVFHLFENANGRIMKVKLLLEDSLNHFSLRKWSFISSLLMHWIPNVVNCLLLFHLLFFRHDLLLFQLGQISLSFHFTYLCLSIWNCVPQLTLAVLKWCLSVGTVIYVSPLALLEDLDLMLSQFKHFFRVYWLQSSAFKVWRV